MTEHTDLSNDLRFWSKEMARSAEALFCAMDEDPSRDIKLAAEGNKRLATVLAQAADELDAARVELAEWRAGRRHHIFGNVLDHYEMLPNDIKSDPGFDNLRRALERLFDFVESGPWRSVADDPPEDFDMKVTLYPALDNDTVVSTWNDEEIAEMTEEEHGFTHWQPFVEPEAS